MILLAIFEYAVLALTFTISKVSVAFAEPLFIIGIRMVFASPLMFLVHKLSCKNASFRIEKSHAHKFLGVGVFHIFIPFTLEFWSLQYVSSSKTALIYALTPFIAALLSLLLLKKKLSKLQFFSLVVAFFSLLPVLLLNDQVEFGTEFFKISLPEIVLIFAVASASYAWFIVSDLMNRGYGFSFINGYAMLIGGSLSLIAYPIFNGFKSPFKGEISDFILWTMILILVANVISYNLYAYVLKKISINLMSAIGFLCPIFACFYGYVLLGEKIHKNQIVALIMVGSAIYLFYREELSKKRENAR